MTSVLSRRQGEDQDRRDDQSGDGEGGNSKSSLVKGAKSRVSGHGRQAGSRGSLAKNKHVVEEFINVGVPHRVAYDQWTQYGEWSKIFKKESAKAGSEGEGRAPRQQDDSDDEGDDNQVTVTAKIGPSKREWQTEVVAQKPGRRIEWEAKGGVQAKGVVTFHRLDDRLTHLQVVIQYKPSGFMESIGNFLRMPRRRVRKDLKLFKNFVDLRGEATGEGPGRVRGDGLRRGLDDQVEQAEGSTHGPGNDSDKDGQDGRRQRNGSGHRRGEQRSQ